MLENFMQFIIIPICKIYFEQVYWELIPLVFSTILICKGQVGARDKTPRQRLF